MTELDAFIFAAGLGTRMGALSTVLPKPAWTLKGKPLLQWGTDLLFQAGCSNIACNAHHHIDVIKSVANSIGGIEVIEEPTLLGTGEPLRRLADRISGEGLLVWNADVIADVPFSHLKSECIKRNVGVGWLLVPHPGGEWTQLYLDLDGRVLPRGVAGPLGPFLFTGAAWWSAKATTLIPNNCFDVRDFLAQYPSHFGVVVDPFKWLEIGTPDQLIYAAQELAPLEEGRVTGCYIHPTASESKKLKRCILGPGINLGTEVEDNDALWFVEDGVQKRLAL
ncbi:MAG: NTP transferase domain-containing protein [Holophagaceae bacterium]|nr:NTP transferase domain-containing protein [Holophagaceae bacterium]